MESVKVGGMEELGGKGHSEKKESAHPYVAMHEANKGIKAHHREHSEMHAGHDGAHESKMKY